MKLILFFSYTSILSTLLPLGALIYYYRIINKPLKILLFVLSVSFLCDIINTILGSYQMNNNPIFTVYTFLEGALFLFFYKSLLSSKKYTRTINFLGLILIFSLILGLLEAKSIFIANTILAISELIILLILSLLLFYNFLKELTVSDLFKDYLFWINSGVLVISSLSIFVFLFERWLENYVLAYLWIVFYIVNILYRLILFKGICLFRNQKV